MPSCMCVCLCNGMEWKNMMLKGAHPLQAAADQRIPPGPQHQLLNLGLMLMGFGHMAILAPLWNTAEAGPWLHQIIGFWGAVGAIGTFGGLSGIRTKRAPDIDV